jgi:hypothetical protein
MRVYLFFFTLLLIPLMVGACSSSGPFVAKKESEQKVSIVAPDVVYDKTSAELIGEEVQSWLLASSIPENAQTNLEQILNGLSNRPEVPYRVSGADEADIRLIVKTVKISRRNFTLNIAKRGPILTVSMQIEIRQQGQDAQIRSFESARNMAEIVGSDKSFYKLTDEEINDPEIQKAVLDEAIDSLLGSAISTILGIRYEQ